MPQPAAPPPENPTTPAAPQVPTSTRTAPQPAHPTDPLTPQAEVRTDQATPADPTTIPPTPHAETRTDPAHPPRHTAADPAPPQAMATTNPAAPQPDRPAIPAALLDEPPTEPAPQTDYAIRSPGLQLENSLADLAEHIEDLTRVIARQATTIDRLADEAKARDRRDRAGADLPLVLELFALHTDTTACAATAESSRERAAFEAIATRIERLIIGRGGTLVTPRLDDAFDSRTMEAADVTKTNDPALDRTIAAVVHTGLTVSGRSVRPAAVVVRRQR